MERKQFIVQDHEGKQRSYAMDVSSRQSEETVLRKVAQEFAKKYKSPKMSYLSVKERGSDNDWMHFQITN